MRPRASGAASAGPWARYVPDSQAPWDLRRVVVARHPPFGEGNANCSQSLGERESFSTKHTHLPLLMRANPSKATTCFHQSICIDRLLPKKSQPRSVGVWSPECGCLEPYWGIESTIDSLVER
jgi:hypothetical protein